MIDGYHGVSWVDIRDVVRRAGYWAGVRPVDLDDHAQDAIERLLKARPPRGSGRRTVTAYAWKVSVYTAKDRVTAALADKRGPTVTLPEWSPFYAYDEQGFIGVEALDLLSRLSQTQAQALMAAFLCGDYSHGGPGSLLGTSDAAAWQRIHRARQAARLAA